ncbi:MAG TPA: hypothetical protein VG055_23400 [Planctomycetaceae bacterium]|jgi:hypothetical protein|nr:hypothetical protein [Planctomycetaceae bacterium]
MKNDLRLMVGPTKRLIKSGPEWAERVLDRVFALGLEAGISVERLLLFRMLDCNEFGEPSVERGMPKPDDFLVALSQKLKPFL